jgi:hypothetical protein
LAQVVTGNAAGTIGALVCYYAGKVINSQVPTTVVGMSIDNMGAAGVTNAYGLSITKPTGATNNYYMSSEVDASQFAEQGIPQAGGGHIHSAW